MAQTEYITAAELEAILIEQRNPVKANAITRFFKAGKGGYAEGDRFLGIPNPQVRSLVKVAWRSTPLEEAVNLVRSQWHEIRLCGLLILVEKMTVAMRRHRETEAETILKTYLSLHPYINNWDLVDLSAIKIVGVWEKTHPEERLMDYWAALPDNCLWQKRMAMVSTWMTLRGGNFSDVTVRAGMMISSRHDLLHKAAGWMLREMYKHGGDDALDDFLEANVSQMPAVMLSYACEKMPPLRRKYWRDRRKQK